MPSVTLGKRFAECILAFAECLRHSAKKLNPVVINEFGIVRRYDWNEGIPYVFANNG